MHMHIGIRARQDRAGAGVEVVQVVIGSPFVVRSGERRPRTRVRTTALIDQALAPCSLSRLPRFRRACPSTALDKRVLWRENLWRPGPGVKRPFALMGPGTDH